MTNTKNLSITKHFSKSVNLFLFTVIFLAFSGNYQSVEAYPNNRREAAAEYKLCEDKKDIRDKIYCMRSLIISLGDYRDSHTGSLSDLSKRELRAIYRKERQRAQVRIAKLTNED